MSEKKILVLSGGGLKGICHVGVIKYLEENKIFDNITTFAGTSVGALMIVLLNIGFTSDELIQFILLFDITKIKSVSIDNLYTRFGLDSGERFLLVIKKLFQSKNINTNISFQELYNKTKKTIILTGVCLNDKTIQYFSHETTPDMEVITALRISTSIPLYFVPVSYNNKLYVDGGCIDNFPIQLFNDKLNQVIGVYLFENKTINEQINNHEDFFMCTIQCMFEGVAKNSIKGFEKYVIKVIAPNLSIFHFVLNSELKQNYYDIGYQSAKNYFN